MRNSHPMQHDISERPLQIMVVEPRGSGGMIHYAYQLCTALSKAGAQVTLVTADRYEMENYQHNFTVRKQMQLWSSTDSAETVKTNSWLGKAAGRSEEHTSELQSLAYLVCRLLLEKKKKRKKST